MTDEDIQRLSSIVLSPALISSTQDLINRREAIDELSTYGEKALPTLSKTVYHQHPNMRERAVLGLGKVGGDQAINILKGLLKSSDSNIVFCSVSALGEIGGEEVNSILVNLIKNEHQDLEMVTIRRILDILIEKGKNIGAETVIEICGQQYPNYLRLEAIERLPKLSSSKLPNVLETILQDSDAEIVREGNKALDKVNSQWAIEMKEKYDKRSSDIEAERKRKIDEAEEKKMNQAITCVDCKKTFTWKDAYQQQVTPGSYLYNPPGHGNYRPRAFCPNCGFLVAEWDIDTYQSRNTWKWYGENAQVNQHGELPPHPLGIWGKSIMSNAQVPVRMNRLDLNLVKPKIINTENESHGEKPSPHKIITDVSKGIDNCFRSRSNVISIEKEKIEALKSYIENEGKSDAKAIATLGMADFYMGKKIEAKELFNRALSFDSSSALSYLGLGMLDYWDSNPDSAKKGLNNLDRAIELDSNLIDAYSWKARILKQNLNDAQGAWNTLQKALSNLGEDKIKADARGSYFFLELGQLCIYNYKGNINDAIRYLDTALSINPNRYEAPLYLMHIYNTLGRSADAARVQLAYEKADQGVGLTNDAIDGIRRYVLKETQEKWFTSSSVPMSVDKQKKKSWQFWKR